MAGPGRTGAARPAEGEPISGELLEHVLRHQPTAAADDGDMWLRQAAAVGRTVAAMREALDEAGSERVASDLAAKGVPPRFLAELISMAQGQVRRDAAGPAAHPDDFRRLIRHLG